jgi:hypothetical protein
MGEFYGARQLTGFAPALPVNAGRLPIRKVRGG